ncbi:hypothetical protein [Bradyrhizobium sp. Ai1a-2]|uniref:DUF7146 domain-containing protein n=1 Tax=Bradyrhizobium sp. Ai1a-2 TaxID=196490 RepID=UPI000416B51A|nr:hypothetical protein [Bradyrhizobium sp. Ai1a-2]
MTRNDTAEIKKRLNEKLEEVLKHFWPGFVTRGKMAYCAPASKADLGSFMVYLARVGKHDRGSWIRYSAGIGGDEINLFAYGLTGNHRATSEDVFDRAREFVGLERGREETPEERKKREDRAAEAAAKRADDDRRAQEQDRARTTTAGGIWVECVAITGTLAEAYLVDARGIPVPPRGWYDCLRFHPRLLLQPDEPPSQFNQAFPCLVCRVDDVFGDLTAIWRIYLDPKKPAKASIREAKMGFGPAAGGAIRLGGLAEHIGAAEGTESALGANALIKYRYPVWAMMSTSGLIGFEVPMEVDWITGFPDGDKPWKKEGNDIVLAEPAGRAAMRRLGERVRALDKRFDCQPEPPIRTDYLDLYAGRRRLIECS